MFSVSRIVTSERGSWKWQDAYRIASYVPHRTKDGRWVWRSIGSGPKRSMPQIRRIERFARLPVGSIHHREISPDDRRWLALE